VVVGEWECGREPRESERERASERHGDVSREAASEQHKNEASRSLLDLLLDHLADAGARETDPVPPRSLSLSLDVDRLQSMTITSSNTSTRLLVRWASLDWIGLDWIGLQRLIQS